MVQNIENEVWKDIEGYEGLYQVSNIGNIKSLERDVVYSNSAIHHYEEKLLKPSKIGGGYLQVTLSKDGEAQNVLVHIIIANAFIPNPNNLPQVGHMDDNKENNTIDNLYWTTAKENNTHNGRHLRVAEKRSKKVLQIDKNTNEVVAEFPSASQAARETGFSQGNISSCCKGVYKQAYGYIWKYK